MKFIVHLHVLWCCKDNVVAYAFEPQSRRSTHIYALCVACGANYCQCTMQKSLSLCRPRIHKCLDYTCMYKTILFILCNCLLTLATIYSPIYRRGSLSGINDIKLLFKKHVNVGSTHAYCVCGAKFFSCGNKLPLG